MGAGRRNARHDFRCAFRSAIKARRKESLADSRLDAHDSELSEAYMSDSRGRRVTPRIIVSATPTISEEAKVGPAPSSASRGPGRPRTGAPKQMTKKQQEDEKNLQALEFKLHQIGPGMDKGGSTLANDDRRRGLYDDEDFEGEVEPDEVDDQRE